MSMNSHVVGIKEPTEEFKKKYAAYRACEEAGVKTPKEILDFFDGISFKYVDATGMEVDLEKSGAVQKWKADSQDGFEVVVDKIPAGVTRIRFVNSW
jgi:hypothetical protein